MSAKSFPSSIFGTLQLGTKKSFCLGVGNRGCSPGHAELGNERVGLNCVAIGEIRCNITKPVILSGRQCNTDSFQVLCEGYQWTPNVIVSSSNQGETKAQCHSMVADVVRRRQVTPFTALNEAMSYCILVSNGVHDDGHDEFLG